MNLVARSTGTDFDVAWAVGLAWKATLVLAAVWVVVLALGRRRAAVAAAVGHAGLAALLVLPVGVVVLPPLAVACLPGPVAAPMSPRVLPAQVVAPAERPAVVGESWPVADGRFADDPTGAALAAERAGADRLRLSVAPASASAGSPSHTPFRWGRAVVGLYLAVVALLLARLGLALAAVGRLRRGAVAVDDPAWLEALGRWRRRLGVRRAVGLAWSGGVGVPVVVGWRNPTVLLPATASALDSAGHADAVLLHELAHVRRGDYGWNLLLRLTQAFYWPHPLVWALGRSLAGVRERACDDLCVYEMGGPSAYRATLLAVATGLVRRPGPALGMAMARPTRLGRRLAGIDRSRGTPRCLPRWPARAALAALALVSAALIGAARLTAADPPAPPKPAPAPAAKPAGRVFHLNVVYAETGKPVPNATVRVWVALTSDWRTADDQGRLEILHSTGPKDRNLSIDVYGPNAAMQRHYWVDDPAKPIPDGVTVKLQPGETLGGLVRDEQGRPVAGATVDLWSHNYQSRDPHEIFFDLRVFTGPDGRWQTTGAPRSTGELLGIYINHPDYVSDRDYTAGREKPTIADLRAGTAVSVMKTGVPITGRVIDADGKPVAGARVISATNRVGLYSEVRDYNVVTDAGGRFRTGQVFPKEYFLVVQVRGHGPGQTRVKVGKDAPEVEIRLGRPKPFRGRVVEPDGKPIGGAFVVVDTWRGCRFLDVSLDTDADGRFRWDDAPDEPFQINLDRRGFFGVFQQAVQPTGGETTFTLVPSLAVNGTVRDAETKQAVTRATVEYGAVDPKTGDVETWTGLPRGKRAIHDVYLRLDFPVSADAYKVRITAEGYAPFVSRAFRRDERVVLNYDVTLAPAKLGDGPVATAFLPDGKPLAGARVYRGEINKQFGITDGKVSSSSEREREVRTGPTGAFPIPADDSRWMVLVLGDESYGFADRDTLKLLPMIETKPYGRVEGRYLIGGRPGANLPVQLSGKIQEKSTWITYNGKTDAEGRFSFDKVIPTDDLHVARNDPYNAPRRLWMLGEPVRVEPGATATVTLGGKGRPLVGRVEPPEGWASRVDFTDNSHASIESDRPWMPYPLALFRGKTSLQGGESSQWTRLWWGSPEGRDYRDRRVALSVGLAADGTFRLDDVPPGDYRLAVDVNAESPREPGPFGRINLAFTVPPIPGGRSDEPLDLGPLRLRPRVTLKVGDAAPAFEVTTVGGEKLVVPDDFKGRTLLLDFGTLWDSQSALQIARMNDVNERFKNDDRFALLSLVCAADGEKAQGWVEGKGQPWPQAVIGPLANPVASAFGIDDGGVPAAVLIGPDGKILATGLYYEKIGAAVGAALLRK